MPACASECRFERTTDFEGTALGSPQLRKNIQKHQMVLEASTDCWQLALGLTLAAVALHVRIK